MGFLEDHIVGESIDLASASSVFVSNEDTMVVTIDDRSFTVNPEHESKVLNVLNALRVNGYIVLEEYVYSDFVDVVKNYPDWFVG